MTFLGFFSLLGLVGIILGSLYLTKLSLKSEEKLNNRKQKVRELSTELIDIDEIVNTLMIYDRNVELIEILLRYMSDMIQSGLKIVPDSEELLQALKDVDQLNERAQSLLNEPKEAETPSSDRQIFIVKKHFARAMKMLRRLHNEGYFDEVTSADHRARLVKNSLLMEVKAYQLQGDIAQKNGDTSTAANFYKHAKELLVNSDLRFPDKTTFIKEISKKISGLYMSMPEEHEKHPEQNSRTPPI